MHTSTRTLAAGFAFPEGPRWHGGRLWFTDQHDGRILALGQDGRAETIAKTSDRPGGLGWLPNGRLLVVQMTTRHILRITDGNDEVYADLTALAPWHCNDMLVDPQGRAYVGNFGYDIDAGEPAASTRLILVDTDGSIRPVGAPLTFPNGMALTPEADELVCAETFAHRISAFKRAADGSLSDRRIWADLGPGPNAPNPDGICLDAEGALWAACPGAGEVLRIHRDGTVTERIRPSAPPYACMLGGDALNTLFICCAETHDPAVCAEQRSGRIDCAFVEVPGTGSP